MVDFPVGMVPHAKIWVCPFFVLSNLQLGKWAVSSASNPDLGLCQSTGECFEAFRVKTEISSRLHLLATPNKRAHASPMSQSHLVGTMDSQYSRTLLAVLSSEC